jgi:transposase
MDVQLDVSSEGVVSRLEVLEGPSGRRRRSKAERAWIGLEGLMPGASVTAVAQKYDVTRWQVYTWRQQVKEGRLTVPEDVAALPAFAELVVDGAESVEAPPSATPPPVAPSPAVTLDNCIDVVMGDVTVRAGIGIDRAHLVAVLRAVREAST